MTPDPITPAEAAQLRGELSDTDHGLAVADAMVELSQVVSAEHAMLWDRLHVAIDVQRRKFQARRRENAQLRAALAEACALLLAVNKFDRIECDNPTVLDSWFEQRNEFLAKHGGAS